MKRARSSLILLAWNRWDLTRRALASLRECELPDCEVIVVDNGSSDATVTELDAHMDWLRIVRLPGNLGYVRGNNAGIAAAAAGSDIVLLNNDLEFVQADWLPRLRACADEAADIGIVGCRLIDSAGHLQHAGSLVLPDTGAGVQIPSGRLEHDIGQYAHGARTVQGVVFAAVYIKRRVLDAIGPLHEDYDTYFEDSDYCLRAAAAGLRSVLCGGVTLLHAQHGSTTTDSVRREALYAQGRAVFSRHWQPTLRARYRQRLLWQSALEFPPEPAAQSRPLIRALDRAGVDVRYQSLYASVLPAALAEDGDSHDYVLNTLRSRPVPSRNSVAVVCGDPALFYRALGAWNIGYAGFETPPLGEALTDWQCADELWVPSEWHRRALHAVSVDRPVSVMAQGIDVDYFHPLIRRVDNPHGEFVFLCVAAWDDVDRPWCVLQAFARAFLRRDPVRLVCWIDAPGRDLHAAIAALRLDPHGGRISFLAPRSLPENQEGVIYRSADALISASQSTWRIEPLLRALAVATPVIAPAHGAAGELLRAADSCTMPVFHNESEQQVALIAAMREILDARAPATARARAASEYVRTYRSIEAAAARIRNRLDALSIASPGSRGARVGRRSRHAPGRVIVLGMHRSGTSCVAGLLQLMGLHGAQAGQWLHAGADNARGHFERADLHNALVRSLRERGGDWSIPLGWDVPSEPAARAELRRAMGPILSDLESQSAWFIKEPRLCLLLPDIVDLIESPVCVHVVRAPAAVARSLVARDGLEMPHALALWEHYNRMAFTASRGLPRVVIDYDAVLDAPLETARILREQLSGAGVGGLREPGATEIAAWVSRELVHWQGATAPVTTTQSRLWDLLRSGEILKRADLPAADPSGTDLLLRLAAEHRAALRRESQNRGT
ncbi:MAG: glycosyltransferase [Tahibacter sp.]